MLHPTLTDIFSFFYPVGNTPAVCLTQDLGPEKHADILLLGCGDVRSILFTTHADSAFKPRQLDITCCDIQRAVLARNILLFSLLIDDTEGNDAKSIWNVYYHLFLDEKALQLLETQSKKLQTLATSLDSWHCSKYGNILRFCDSGTLKSIREVWDCYSISEKSDGERINYEKRYKADIQKAVDVGKGLGYTSPVTAYRSAAPVSALALKDLPQLYQCFWDHGVTDKEPGTLQSAGYSNPMFAKLVTDNFLLHYATDPLLGFHLATGYVPLTSNSQMRLKHPSKSLPKAVAAARLQFQAWTASFRKRASQNMTIRFFVGDALAFCHTLQHKRATTGGAAPNWYRTPYTLDVLDLDSIDYNTTGKAPLFFNVIDTSNVADHIGVLNILVASAPLLENNTLATLYTESLVKVAGSRNGWMNNLLCGDFPTVSTLLGLFPVEYWTNATAVSTVDDGIFDSMLKVVDESSRGQMRSRLVWKQPPSSQGSNLHFEEQGLAKLLHQIYQTMFQHENFQKLFSNLSPLTLQNSSLLHYNRVSFVSLLRLVRNRVSTDWNKVMGTLLTLVERDPTILMGSNYIQELYLHLHLLDLYTVDTLRPSFNQTTLGPSLIGLSSWKNIPAVVSITLRVPRKALEVFTSLAPNKLGSPIVHCILESIGTSSIRPWLNIFSAVQLSFGMITTFGSIKEENFQIHVTEDKSGWAGSSPLLVSFYAPAWVVLLEPETTKIALGVQCTPQSTKIFLKSLGLSLNVYQTSLVDEDNVFITKYRPNQIGYTSVCASKAIANAFSKSAIRTKITADFDRETSKIVSLTGRFDFLTEEDKQLLKDQSPIEVIQPSPCALAILIGKDRIKHTLHFPAAVLHSHSKTRIARKSSYIEIIAPIAFPTDIKNRHHNFIFPSFPRPQGPVIWNLPYLNLESLPIIDISNSKTDLQWLSPHTAMQLSDRERQLRDASMISKIEHNDVRTNFKDSVFSLFMKFSGVQGPQTRIFGLNYPTKGGIHVLIIVSCLRLDLANHTPVLDCAVLPLMHRIMPKLGPFFRGLSNLGLCNIKVDGEELKLWKELLPAMVERCRRWAHRADCEYNVDGHIPVSVEEGKAVLCSCGEGNLPTKFVSGIPHWDLVSKYAVRAAISPTFSVPFVEQIVDVRRMMRDAATGLGLCQNCGKEKSKDGKNLLICSRCRNAKYCSGDCQRAHWKEHKKVCPK